MKKLGVIGIRGLPASYGAFDQFVDQFVKYSNNQKEYITFYISSDKKNKKKILKNLKTLNRYFFIEEREYLYCSITFFQFLIFISKV